MGILAAASISSSADTGSWSLLVVFFVLAISVSFACSIFEAVLLSLTRPYIANLKRTRPAAGTRLDRLKDKIDGPLTAILTLNTVAHTVGSIGVGNEAAGLAIQHGWGGWVAGVTAAVMTLAVLILSEIIPKTLGARHWRKLGPVVGMMLEKLTWLMTPAIQIIRLFDKEGHRSSGFSREELEVMAELGRREGKLQEGESRILRNLLQLRDGSVRDVMTPRVVVFALSKQTTVEQFVSDYDDTPFSRIPVFGENRDDILGFVLKTDVLLAAAKDDYKLSMSDLIRDIVSLPSVTSLTKAFEGFVTERQQIAMVVDEFGGFAGIVTMEDVVETLLGLEIVDEADTKEDMQAFARSLWQKRARNMGIELEELEDDGDSS